MATKSTASAEPSMKDAVWPLKRIIPYAANARTHPPEQVSLLASILRRRGPDQRIVVDEKGIILKGHGRRLAALEAKMATFPITQRFGLSDRDKREIRLEDNQVSLLSGWENTLLQDELATLRNDGVDLTALGFLTIEPQPAAQAESVKPSKNKTIFVTVSKRVAKKARAAIVRTLDEAGIEHNL